MSTTPLVIPLTNGTTQDISDLDARRPGIAYSENVDFLKSGAVNARPGYSAFPNMDRRTFALVAGTVGTSSVASAEVTPTVSQGGVFSDKGVGMFRYRDAMGERPGLTVHGRVWTLEGTNWADRLYCGASTVDRLSEFIQYSTSFAFPAVSNRHLACGFNFSGTFAKNTGFDQGYALLGATPAVEEYASAGGFSAFNGGACEAVVGVDTYHCHVTSDAGGNTLLLNVRKNNDKVITSTALAFDASAVTYLGDAPSCSSSATAGAAIWILYKKTAANSYNLLKVNPVTGAIIAGPVTTVLANITGLWVHVQTAGARVLCAFTQTATKGVALRSHNPTTLALNAASNFQFDSVAVNNAAGPVVIGGRDSGNVVVQYTRASAVAGTALGVNLGIYNPTAPTCTPLMLWEGWKHAAATTDAASIQYGIPFSPIHLGTPGRTIVGLSVSTYGAISPVAGPTPTPAGSATTLCTWYALDITDKLFATETRVWGTRNVGILGSGPIQGSAYPYCAQSALIDYSNTPTKSFRFSSTNFLSFGASTGGDPSTGLNRITLITPDTDSIGEQTVLSGSVPHAIARGYCYELGFLQIAPEIWCTDGGGGTGVLALGSYSVQCVWKWFDDSGQVHRSAPSQNVFTVSLAANNSSIFVNAHNLIVTQREFGDITLEVYCTKVNPTSADQKFLQSSTPQVNLGSTGSVVTPAPITTIQMLGPVDVTSLPLYTVNGIVLQNLPVPADGGVATVNNRMWLSDGRFIYGSKRYLSNGTAPQWNDEGNLTLSIPSPSGKVLALKGLGDKLLIFCERGIYWSQGDGPDDAGTGPTFLTPQLASTLGVSNERGAVVTEHGVVFHTSNAGASGSSVGGLYVVTGGLGVERVSAALQDSITSTPYVLAYVPERDILMAGNTNETKAHVLDLRHKEYTLWTTPNANVATSAAGSGFTASVGSNGTLWAFADSTAAIGFAALGTFNRADNQDQGLAAGDVAFRDYTYLLQTNQIFANAADALGWSRVRAVSVYGSTQSTSSTVNLSVQQDQIRTPLVGGPSSGLVALSPTWPAQTFTNEFRLANQKCAQLKVTISCFPCRTISLSALRLDIIPSRSKTPANNRV